MYDLRHNPSATMEQVAALQQEIAELYSLDNYTIDWPETGHIRFRGRFLRDLADCYDDLRSRFERHGFTPFVRRQDDETILIAAPIVFDPPPSNWRINLLFLTATILSTLFVGALSEMPPGSTGFPGLGDLWRGMPYAVSLMAILGAHELGHYFAARHHGVPVSLPYFIPFPLPPIGTMGAFIRLKAPVKNKRALFDVGAAGPLAGLALAIPILIYGLATSPVEPLPTTEYMLEGNSVLYASLKLLVKGQFLPSESQDIFLNAFAWAGWVGLLVTGLNLLPVGQLDGGHVSYVLFGKKARRFFLPVIVALAALGLATGTVTWGVWVLLLFLVGRHHAEPLDDVTPLDGRRRALAIFTLLLFFLVFVPIPLQIIS
jgi:membrane-associated protease RseP (regulator of RpoE activity)